MIAEAKILSSSLTLSISNILVIGPDIFMSIPRIKKHPKTRVIFSVIPMVIMKGIEHKPVRTINLRWVVFFIIVGVTKIPRKIKN
jgi:hypothetical protein